MSATATPTPGQVCYEAWERAMAAPVPVDAASLWPILGGHEQHAWEVAAEAVLALTTRQEETP